MSEHEAPKMPVKCSVENCSYNQSRMCHAKKIEVRKPEGEKPKRPEGTFCSTFETRMY